jgi:hypothetical protein
MLGLVGRIVEDLVNLKLPPVVEATASVVISCTPSTTPNGAPFGDDLFNCIRTAKIPQEIDPAI